MTTVEDNIWKVNVSGRNVKTRCKICGSVIFNCPGEGRMRVVFAPVCHVTRCYAEISHESYTCARR
jgi:hypothetical protein